MLLIIFGAGASFDHDIRVRQTSSRIPLTNGLIDEGLGYVQVAKTNWPGAVPIINHLNELKRKNTNFNLEDALYSEFQRNKDAVKAQLISFKYYLHDIIRNSEYAVRQANQGNTNYTKLLQNLQRRGTDDKKGISLVSFNYDTLIETACTQLYPTWEFIKFDDYIEGNDKLRLFKPHGSLSWNKIYQPQIHNPDTVSIIKIMQDTSRSGYFSQGEQIVNYYYEHNSKVQGSNSVTEPIIALPYKEKTSFVFPPEHMRELLREINNITHILTIGWRGEEVHFQKEVLSAVPSENQLKVLNINNGGNSISQNLTRVLGARIKYMANYGHGFSSCLKEDYTLNEFLSE